jgi:hypothetical protein
MDYKRIGMLLLAAVISVVFGIKYHHLLWKNDAAVNVIVTIFSILAGFLIAVITLIVDPILSAAKNASQLKYMRSTIKRKLFRHNALFVLYLFSLGLSLLMFLTPDQNIVLKKLLHCIFLSISIFVFMISFTLPFSLMRIQLEKYDAKIDDKENS